MNKSAQIFTVLTLALMSGCGGHKSGKAKDALVDQMSALGGPETAKLRMGKNGKSALLRPMELPGAVQGTGWHIPWYAPDPKNPKGRPQRVLIADAQRGALQNKKGVVKIVLREVHATLYHEGKPSATLDAPQVTTNGRDRIIIATGGVTIHSILDPKNRTTGRVTPADTTVTADKVVWNSHATQVICTGNAHLNRKQPGQPDVVTISRQIIYHTDTGEFELNFTPE